MKWHSRGFFLIQILSCVLIIQSIKTNFSNTPDKKQISFSFLNIYPQSSLKNLVSMTMRLWAEVNELQENPELNLALKASNKFSEQVLLLNTALDTTLIDAAHSMHQCPEYIEIILHDMQQILDIIKELTKGYASILATYTEKQLTTATSLFILEHIINKMRKIISQGAIPTNLYFALQKPSQLPFNFKPVNWLNLA